MSKGSKRGVVYKPRKEDSRETNPAITLTLDFQSPEPWGNTFLSFNLPDLRYFVMAAWTDCCTHPSQGGFRLLWPRIWQSEHRVWQAGGYPRSKCAQDHRESPEVLLTTFSPVSEMSTGSGSKTHCKSESHKSLWDDSLEIFRLRDGMNPGFPGGSDGKESTYIAGDLGSRSLGGGHGNPLQYSCLENPRDRRATVHGVTKNQTWPSDLHTRSPGSLHF